MALATGTRLGHYDIVAPLGAGGMGEVYRARDRRLGRDVALKVLTPGIANDPELVARFEREARAVAALNHPAIVVLHSIEEHEGTRFLTMELAEGKTLDRHLDPHGLPIARVLEIGIALADALAAAHGKGVVHRDLKPGNVMLTPDGSVKVLDFGLAKLAAVETSPMDTFAATRTSPLTTAGQVMGTVPYMAPEQLRGETVDARADLFALGVVLYELAAGRRPFAGANLVDVGSAILRDPPSPLSKLRADVPRELARTVHRCLEKRPADRYQSAIELARDLRRLQRTNQEDEAVGHHRARLGFAIAGAALLVVAVSIVSARHATRVAWARAEVPRVAALADSGNTEGAWLLALRLQSVLHDDPKLAAAWPRISRVVSIRTDPPGARVLRRAFGGPDTTWRVLGTTPLDSVRVPLGGWYMRFEKSGFQPLQVLAAIVNPLVVPTMPKLEFTLDSGRGPDAGMMRVPGGVMGELNLAGLEAEGGVSLDPFWISRYEVTNREFKRFVDAGGYRRREFWNEAFRSGDSTLPWEAVLVRFKDRTGRPGPATWEAGDFPAGQEDHPVSGVSWFEAAAYARYAGRSLPTVYHWVRAARTPSAAYVVPRSNFDGHGPSRVGTYSGIGPFGTFDMAGNVREWCANAAGTARYILGGGWNDPGYAFTDAYTQSPFDRSATNGIRLARYQANDTTLATLGRSIVRHFRNFSEERPAPDALYSVYRRQYDYDPAPLDAAIEGRDTTAADYVVEKVTYATAYGRERMTAYLFLPRRTRQPFQAVVFFPGSNALTLRTYDPHAWVTTFDYLLKSGRAVLMPIYLSTFERGDGYQNDIADESIAFRDHMVAWAKDFRRSVDYLETRRDVDARLLAYYGLSWGGFMGGIIPAVEPRIRTVILYVAGLQFTRPLPEVEPFNFLPRVRQPVLMLNGSLDHYFPVETSQRPFFETLGTPPAQKRIVIAPGGHFVPRNQLIRESLDWLDRTLGTVR